ncbi:MAG: potassium-transporting ATPase subunit KdpC [Leptospirillum sp.]
MKIARQSLMATLFLMFICGVVYPLAVTGMAHLVFSGQAEGSLVKNANNTVVGSSLIAQGFQSPRYFHPRPSAALTPDGSGPLPYDGAFSSPSNIGPDTKQEIKNVSDAANAYRQENHLPHGTPVPVDAVTASGSGLDPDISLENALLQVPRVAEARKLNPETVRNLVLRIKDDPQFGFLGTARVNVLKLNMALDTLALKQN